jgi:hypothetical protein
MLADDRIAFAITPKLAIEPVPVSVDLQAGTLQPLLEAPWTTEILDRQGLALEIPRLELPQAPLWGATAFVLKAWLDVLKGTKLTQRALWLFVRARPQDFEAATGRNGADLGSYGPILAAELQKLEVSKTGKVVLELGAMGETLFTAGEDKTQISGRLPVSFRIRIPLLRDVRFAPEAAGEPDAGGLPDSVEPEYPIDVFLTIETKDGTPPAFQLEAPGLELAQVQASEDALESLRQVLAAPAPSGFLVGLGEAKLVSVPRVRD